MQYFKTWNSTWSSHRTYNKLTTTHIDSSTTTIWETLTSGTSQTPNDSKNLSLLCPSYLPNGQHLCSKLPYIPALNFIFPCDPWSISWQKNPQKWGCFEKWNTHSRMAPQTADEKNMLGNMLSNYTLKCEDQICWKKCLRMYPPNFLSESSKQS
jgi:hypothetical protein